MKYSEFREYLKSNDFEMREDEEMIKVIVHTFKCIIVSKKAPEEIVLPYLIGKTKNFKLLKKSLELAETPLDEREEEKKYYLKHRYINNWGDDTYLNYVEGNYIILTDKCQNPNYKTKFTKAEIEDLKVEFNTDLNDFEFIEVEFLEGVQPFPVP